MYCKVITASRSGGIGNGLTYETGSHEVRIGDLVRVPLRSKLTEGLVVELMQTNDSEYDVKQVEEVLSRQPLLAEAQLQTAQWMADHYLTTLRQALAPWLPSPPWARFLPDRKAGYRVLNGDMSLVRGKKQVAIMEYLQGRDWVSAEELKRELEVTKTHMNALLEKRIVEEELQTVAADGTAHLDHVKGLPVLTSAQQQVADSMSRDPRPSLLFGVTGSGKTEIYAQMIVDTIRAGKQAIVLVPEILLTEHSIHRYETLLNRKSIAVLHSRLTPAARLVLWKRIRRGDIAMVLGSRSALFAPMPHLGLVIIDEEHEWTFKNEQTPRYHARDTAETLCRFSGAKLVLGTATPSMEAWVRAKDGRYQMERLPMRYKDQAMPDVRIIDLADVDFGSMYPFSPPLLDAIEAKLRKKEQVVLFLNRRGVATSLLCLECRRRVVSPESLLPFTVHQTHGGKPFLMDHTSGLTAALPARCPHCDSTKLLAVGAGTQKVEHILGKKFPQARLLRADADTMSHPDQMREMLSAMREGRADILLGTQSVVKGLDLPNVTLAAVVLADVGLSLPHFRAGERIFQLLTQLTGRSGRAKQGEVIIQTFRPNAPEILAASRHETEQYLDQELKLRAYTNYPPTTEMLRLIVRDNDPAGRARSFTVTLQKNIDALGLHVTAKCAPTFFGGGREWHILLRGTATKKALEGLNLDEVIIDVDPMETV
ncbi:MAG: primosomal protein [Candidatus Peribacteria bacterium]|nr:primosomal protein [Candidatus Peribacteria bacterium]